MLLDTDPSHARPGTLPEKVIETSYNTNVIIKAWADSAPPGAQLDSERAGTDRIKLNNKRYYKFAKGFGDWILEIFPSHKCLMIRLLKLTPSTSSIDTSTVGTNTYYCVFITCCDTLLTIVCTDYNKQ